MCQEHSAKSIRTSRVQRATPSDLFDTDDERALRATAGGQRPPALRVFDTAGLVEAPREWSLLNERSTRDRVQLAAKSVGRIHQGSVTLGTGFLVANDVVMTNRHVAESFTTNIDGILKVRVGWRPAIDFIGDHVPKMSPSQAKGAHAALFHTGSAAVLPHHERALRRSRARSRAAAGRVPGEGARAGTADPNAGQLGLSRAAVSGESGPPWGGGRST